MKKPPTGTGLILAAARFAAEKHSGQLRKGAMASPYINHPLALAETLHSVGKVRDSITLAAALLHDTIEDTGTTQVELAKHFGRMVASIVAEVTDDKSLPKDERKQLQIEHAADLSRGAKLVKLADKICNLEDILADPPADWPLRRRQDYFDWAKQVVDRLGPVNRPMMSRFARLYRQRPMQ